MYKFIYFSDLHADNRLFLSRKDNFELSCLSKLKDIVDASNKLDCQVLCGGDLVNGPYLGHSFINQMIDILKGMRRPLNLILGNHDITGRNLRSYNSSTLGLMVKSGVLTIMEKPGLIEDFLMIPVPYDEAQTAISYDQHFKDIFPGNYDIDRKPRLIITHNMILPTPTVFNHILASDVAKVIPSNSVLLIGHYHVPFSCTENDVRFINIGSAGRVSRSPGENRTPEYAVITLDGSDIDIDRRTFPSAKSWDEIFEPKLEHSSGNILIDAKDFFSSYEDKSLNLDEIMLALSTKMKISLDVVIESKRRLELARDRMHIENNKYG